MFKKVVFNIKRGVTVYPATAEKLYKVVRVQTGQVVLLVDTSMKQGADCNFYALATGDATNEDPGMFLGTSGSLDVFSPCVN